MIILGIQPGKKLETDYNLSGVNHDSAAVLIKDGEIVAAIEEERLSRIKHCNFFPKRAIDFCLKQGGITIDKVDFIAVNFSLFDLEREMVVRTFEDATKEAQSGTDFMANFFENLYNHNISDKLIFCNHHTAHAWSSFPLSGFDESLVMVLDGQGPSGDGRDISGIIGVAEKNNFKIVREIDVQNSLGKFYETAIKFIAYDLFDEYKVMGLAPYGDPAKFRSLFKQLYTLQANGNYSIVPKLAQRLWQELLKPSYFKSFRRVGDPIEQVHKDFAASLQESLEEIVLNVIKATQKEFKKDYLCFAGGVAHNCTLNGKIEKSGIFKNVFVQPAAHDAGGALGAALYAHSINSPKRINKLKHLYYGSPIPKNDVIAEELSKWQPVIKFTVFDNVCFETAELIANDAVIGWIQGRSEFGPRALGNRSILADPRLAGNKERINKMIKKREGYRPFAPSVLAERACDFFEIDTESRSSLFMNLITSVKEEKRANLGAITHVDGTARIQVVQKETNPKYWELINQFSKITDIPILLNTSFNNNVEPIVDSISDAIVCFLTTELTHLVIDNFIVYKNEVVQNYLHNFQISFKESYKLVSGFKTVSSGYAKNFSIEFNGSRFFSRTSAEISENLFRIIGCSEAPKIGDRARELDISFDDKLMNEIFNLWSERIICLSPTI